MSEVAAWVGGGAIEPGGDYPPEEIYAHSSETGNTLDKSDTNLAPSWWEAFWDERARLRDAGIEQSFAETEANIAVTGLVSTVNGGRFSENPCQILG